MALSSNPKRVVVIGGGLAGLASAVELQGRGARVTVIETNEHLGGKMNVLSEDGFTFDMGPTILTLPSVLKRIFAEAGRKMEDYLDLVELETIPQLDAHVIADAVAGD